MKKKNPHAQALGRRGGKARVKNQTAEERSQSAAYAASIRWAPERVHITNIKHHLVSGHPMKACDDNGCLDAPLRYYLKIKSSVVQIGHCYELDRKGEVAREI